MADTKAETIVTISAVVTRADGTVEDLGVVATNVTTPRKGLFNLLKKRVK